MSAPRAFAFGKLPTHGDFVARGLGAEAKDAWDAWCSAGLEDARTVLGTAFEARHDTAPPCRFLFGPSAFGEGWRAGALAASIDTAGRRFVIVLGGETLQPPGAGDQIATAAESEIYRAFQAADDIDAMLASAQDVFQTMESGPGPQAEGRFWVPDSTLDITASQPPADLITQVLTI